MGTPNRNRTHQRKAARAKKRKTARAKKRIKRPHQVLPTTGLNGFFGVGGKYWPSNLVECCRLELDTGGLPVLYCFIKSPTADEMVAHSAQSSKKFAVLVHGPIIFLLYKFGNQPWSDSPLSVCIYSDAENRLSTTSYDGVNDSLPLTRFLVDSTTGVLKSIGITALPPQVTKALTDAIHHQWANHTTFSRAEYDAAVALAYRHYPNSYDMVKDATAFGTVDNEPPSTPTANIELRTSMTPTGDLAVHVDAPFPLDAEISQMLSMLVGEVQEKISPFIDLDVPKEWVRDCGKRLNELGGFTLMEAVYVVVINLAQGTPFPRGGRALELAWHGIGTWQG